MCIEKNIKLENDLMCLVELIKDVFDIECGYEIFQPRNFKVKFNYKYYEIEIYTSVNIYNGIYDESGNITIEIKDKRKYIIENNNRLSFEPAYFNNLLGLYDDISYNSKFNNELYKEYLYILKEYIDDDKLYFILYNSNDKKKYILYKNKLKELKLYCLYGNYYIECINLFGGKIARRMVNFKIIYEDDFLYDIEKLRKRHSIVSNKKLREELDFLKDSIKEIFGNIKINDSTEIKESVYNTLDFEYKNYLIDISSYFDERHGKTYDEAKYQINIDLLDKDNIYKEELLIGARFNKMLAIRDHESFNMKFNKELYKNYLYKVKEYIDKNEIYTFILSDKDLKKYRLYKGEKIMIKSFSQYEDSYKNSINLYGEEGAKEIEKYKPIYENN